MSERPWPALLLLALSLLTWSPHAASVRHRLADFRIQSDPSAPRRRPDGKAAGEELGEGAARRRRWLLAGGAGLAAAVLVGGVVGLAAGTGVAVAGDRLLRRSAPDTAERAFGAALVRDLPGACDLLAVCLAAGLPVGGALAAVGEAVPAPLGPQLRAVAGLYRLGAEPRRAWAEAPVPLATLGRALVRAGESGTSVVPALRALASEARTEARAATRAAVDRAGVWVLAPLGLCFLPAFVCLGVVPLVLGIAGDVFG